MPLAAPVITATLSLKTFMVLLLLLGNNAKLLHQAIALKEDKI
jgi:hypothetical protein